MRLSALRPGSLTLRVVNPRVRSNLVFNRLPYRAVEMPSVNGIGQARGIAKAYSVFATGGKELTATLEHCPYYMSGENGTKKCYDPYFSNDPQHYIFYLTTKTFRC